MDYKKLKKRIRFFLAFFALALIVSGATAIPLELEMDLLKDWFGAGTFMAQVWPSLSAWMDKVHEGVINTGTAYPFMAYGTDWLAFGHFVIGSAFFWPIKEPEGKSWVIEWAMLACIMLIPAAFIFGVLRGIPLLWTAVDCAFGVFGLIPLWFLRKDMKRLTALRTIEASA